MVRFYGQGKGRWKEINGGLTTKKESDKGSGNS